MFSLLRIYWYDGARSGPTVDHLTIANMRDVKLRLGSINGSGQQKEVDALLVTDLIELARNQSICDATLVTGDTDVRIAVQIAQTFGVRVHLVGLEPSLVSQSPSLRREVDTVHEISRSDVARFLRSSLSDFTRATPNVDAGLVARDESPAEPQAQLPVTVEHVGKTLEQISEEALSRVLVSLSADEVDRLSHVLAKVTGVPKELDGKLLGTARSLLGRNLTQDEKRQLRSVFIGRVQSLASLP